MAGKYNVMKMMSDFSEATCMGVREENSACQAFRIELKMRQKQSKKKKCSCRKKEPGDKQPEQKSETDIYKPPTLNCYV